LSRGKLFYSGAPENAFAADTIKQVFDVHVKEYKHNDTIFLDFYT
jgi:iron complex transport system ATP-binding protein